MQVFTVLNNKIILIANEKFLKGKDKKGKFHFR